MIASVHLAAPGPLRALRSLREVPGAPRVDGLGYAETALVAPLGGGLLPRPSFSQAGLIASWDDEKHLDRFLDDEELAGPFSSGWHVRMRALRVVGSWPAMPGLPERPIEAAEEGPIAVLTLGRPRARRIFRFLGTSAKAEAELAGTPGLLASTGLAHPPRLVSTFSLWESVSAMRAYSQEPSGPHMGAVRGDRVTPFHHESAFIRLRPFASSGLWGERDPLAGLLPDGGREA